MRVAVIQFPGSNADFDALHAARDVLGAEAYYVFHKESDLQNADAVIVPPTAQNQTAIERDLWQFVEANVDQPDDDLRRGAEATIRNHDPCISCATHFLDLTVVRS